MSTFFRICGIDEAGRGALAGPLVAAAVILPNKTIKTVLRRAGTKIRDGKLLTAMQRKKIYVILKGLHAEITVEVISTRSINNHGIGWANRKIMRRLIKKVEADEYIADGNIKLGRIKGKTHKLKSVIDADAAIPAVILAGIVAKVERDRLMNELHKEFPEYHWEKNKGYGTKDHFEAIKTFGQVHYHRGIYVSTALKIKLLKNRSITT